LATQVFAETAVTPRQQVLESYLPALKLQGNAAHGRKIYQERCISCHRLGGEGYALGPDLVTVKNSGKEKILINILDPNREVRPEFNSYVVQMKNEESLLGIVGSETSTSVTIRQAYGVEHVIRRADIKALQSQGQSLMPEGLEAGLVPQDFADLVEYIETAEQDTPRRHN
jgi:putative heme-binding domain-containing protein